MFQKPHRITSLNNPSRFCSLSLNKPNVRTLEYVFYELMKGLEYKNVWHRCDIGLKLTAPSQKRPLQLGSNPSRPKKPVNVKRLHHIRTWRDQPFLSHSLCEPLKCEGKTKRLVSFSFRDTGYTRAKGRVSLWNNTQPPLVGGHVVCNISAAHLDQCSLSRIAPSRHCSLCSEPPVSSLL